MAWTATDAEKIRKYLNIPATQPNLDKLTQCMTSTAEAQITTAQAAIRDLDDLVDRQNAALESDSQALKRADVLEWDLSRRNAGLDRRIGETKRSLAEAIAWSGDEWQGGAALLLRS